MLTPHESNASHCTLVGARSLKPGRAVCRKLANIRPARSMGLGTIIRCCSDFQCTTGQAPTWADQNGRKHPKEPCSRHASATNRRQPGAIGDMFLVG